MHIGPEANPANPIKRLFPDVKRHEGATSDEIKNVWNFTLRTFSYVLFKHRDLTLGIHPKMLDT
jgi:hypothetical protein